MPKEANTMIVFQTGELEIGDFWLDEDPQARGRGGFPLVGVPGTESVGLVYFEIEPGNRLGLHTDSQDEVVVLLSGTAVGAVGEESGELTAGSIVFVPAMVPHGFKNVGNDMLRCVGVFPNSDVVATFEYALQPFGSRVIPFRATAPAQV
jgi:quercetin dioxygenase-like cupin family protein